MDHQQKKPGSHPLVRLMWPSLSILLMMALGLLQAAPASAQNEGPPPARDYVSCGHFEIQADAQAILDSGTLDEIGMQSLDGDGDGIACEEAFELDPDSPPLARDYTSCGHFETQEDAQELLDSGLLDELGRQSLDGDGNGIACEGVFGDDTAEPTVPAPSAPAAPTAPAPSTTTVTGLPTTGTGPAPVPDWELLALGTLAILSSGAALAVRRHTSR